MNEALAAVVTGFGPVVSLGTEDSCCSRGAAHSKQPRMQNLKPDPLQRSGGRKIYIFLRRAWVNMF